MSINEIEFEGMKKALSKLGRKTAALVKIQKEGNCANAGSPDYSRGCRLLNRSISGGRRRKRTKKKTRKRYNKRGGALSDRAGAKEHCAQFEETPYFEDCCQERSDTVENLEQKVADQREAGERMLREWNNIHEQLQRREQQRAAEYNNMRQQFENAARWGQAMHELAQHRAQQLRQFMRDDAQTDENNYSEGEEEREEKKWIIPPKKPKKGGRRKKRRKKKTRKRRRKSKGRKGGASQTRKNINHKNIVGNNARQNNVPDPVLQTTNREMQVGQEVILVDNVEPFNIGIIRSIDFPHYTIEMQYPSDEGEITVTANEIALAA